MSFASVATITISAILAIVTLQSETIAETNAMPAQVLTSENSQLSEAINGLVCERPPVKEFGAVLANIHDFSEDLRQTAKQELDFSDRLQIISITQGSIADQLGLRPGDQLLQINSFYVTRGKTALEKFSQRIIPSVDWQKPVNTTIIRDGIGQSRSNKHTGPKD